jgi:hypothetical protein
MRVERQDAELVIGTEQRGRLVLRPVPRGRRRARELLVTLDTAGLTATVTIRASEGWGTFKAPQQLFHYMAKEWRGWEGPVGWVSADDAVWLTATSDHLGHITLEVALFNSKPPWSVSGAVHLSAGELADVAREVDAFIRHA